MSRVIIYVAVGLLALFVIVILDRPFTARLGHISGDHISGDHISASNSAYEGKLSYDPTSCSEDAHGMVYLSIGNLTLRQPTDNLRGIKSGSADWRAQLPQPPVLSEPEGCPSHPIQAIAFDLTHLSAMPGERTSGSIYADHVSVTLSNGPFALTEEILFEQLAKARGVDNDEETGFTRTRTPTDDAYYDAYQANGYLTPSGEPFTAACKGDTVHNGLVSCKYGYQLQAGVSIWCRFLVTEVPVEKMLDADREIRLRFRAASSQN